jgi:hypothetical protein
MVPHSERLQPRDDMTVAGQVVREFECAKLNYSLNHRPWSMSTSVCHVQLLLTKNLFESWRISNLGARGSWTLFGVSRETTESEMRLGKSTVSSVRSWKFSRARSRSNGSRPSNRDLVCARTRRDFNLGKA